MIPKGSSFAIPPLEPSFSRFILYFVFIHKTAKFFFQGRTIFEGELDKFLSRFHFLTFDEKVNQRLKEPNYFTAPFIAAHLDW